MVEIALGKMTTVPWYFFFYLEVNVIKLLYKIKKKQLFLYFLGLHHLVSKQYDQQCGLEGLERRFSFQVDLSPSLMKWHQKADSKVGKSQLKAELMEKCCSENYVYCAKHTHFLTKPWLYIRFFQHNWRVNH